MARAGKSSVRFHRAGTAFESGGPAAAADAGGPRVV